MDRPRNLYATQVLVRDRGLGGMLLSAQGRRAQLRSIRLTDSLIPRLVRLEGLHLMKLIVTGGAGFIGSHLCDALIKEGHDLVCIDDLSLGRLSNIAHLLKPETDRFRLVELDILDRDRFQAVVAEVKPDAIFHLAANSDIPRGLTEPETDLKKTFLTTFEVLLAMKNVGIKQLIFASTSAIYGELDIPLTEDVGPLKPISLYGAGKLGAEAFVSAFSACFGIQAWVFRFPNVVGERATHGAMFDFINKLEANPAELVVLGDGSQSKPYVYVKDLVAGILFGWANSGDPYNCFNLGVESTTTVRRIAEIVREEMTLDQATIRYTGGDRGWVGDVPHFRYDLTKVHRLGWRAKMTSDEALRAAVRAELDLRKGKESAR
jgi:UDP-glucose 4-epimerase